jgi:predicted MPP superfamily phosphohydrolase
LIEPRWIQKKTITIPIDELPAELEGLRIVHLSDLHLGPYFKAGDIQRAVAIANEMQPDLAVITGDFILWSINNMYSCTEALKALRPRFGVYAVLGNHECFTGEPDLAEVIIENAGMVVLRNEAVPLSTQGKGLWLVGTDELWFHFDDLPKALSKVPKGAKTILLSHSPDIAHEAAYMSIDLVLSGHTHGGQFSLPVIGALMVPNEHTELVAGLYQIGGTRVYISKGVGAVTPPGRLFTRPDITLIILEKA